MNRHIIRLLAVLVMGLMLMLGSCASAIDDQPQPDEAKYSIGLYVNLGATETVSRASLPSGPDYESGTGLENYVNMNDLEVYLFTIDDKLISRLTGEDMYSLTEFKISPVTDESTSATYMIDFRVDKLLPDVRTRRQSFKILMFANWGEYPSNESLIPGVTTIDDLTKSGNAIADYKSGMISADNPIPFFGVQEYYNVQFGPDLITIHKDQLLLLRALAKIDVTEVAGSVKKITSVTLNRYNSKFYKAPLGVTNSSQYTNYGNGMDFAPSLSLPQDNPFGWELADQSADLTLNEDGHFIIYVPEYKNIGRNDNRCSYLSVKYEDGQEFTVDFKYYNDAPSWVNINDPYDIRRNYWYQFLINRNRTDIDVSVDVLPYKVITLKPEFGLDDPKDPNEDK